MVENGDTAYIVASTNNMVSHVNKKANADNNRMVLNVSESASQRTTRMNAYGEWENARCSRMLPAQH
jgi:stringent starvation protein B